MSVVGAAIHSGFVTPFADMVLLSFNAAFAIIIQIVLAIVFLKEVCSVKYDVTAIILIMIGSACIILTANFQEVELKMSDIMECLTSAKSITYYAFMILLISVTFMVLNRMLAKLAIFEREVETWLYN